MTAEWRIVNAVRHGMTNREIAQRRGISLDAVMGAPHMIRHSDGTEEWMAFFKDPEGRPLALMAQVWPNA